MPRRTFPAVGCALERLKSASLNGSGGSKPFLGTSLYWGETPKRHDIYNSLS